MTRPPKWFRAVRADNAILYNTDSPGAAEK